MRIAQLKLTDFRNYDVAEFLFGPKKNIFIGNNGLGKTNIVEAIHYLTLLKSFRLSEDQSLIRHGANFGKIEAKMIRGDIEYEYRVIISLEGKKCYLNGKEVKRISTLSGLMNAIVFSSDDVSLLKFSSLRRREFLDDELKKLSPSYYYALLSYQKLMKQKNELLKERMDEVLLDVIHSQMSEYSFEIINKRKEFLIKLEKKSSDYIQQLFGKDYDLHIHYLTLEKCSSQQEIYECLQSHVLEDIQRKTASKGIHKDDFKVFFRGMDIKQCGSQGQHRLVVIAMKLALLEIIKEMSGEEAIVILDDVFSELDFDKSRLLLQILNSNAQVFITSAISMNEDENVNYFYINEKKDGGMQDGQ